MERVYNGRGGELVSYLTTDNEKDFMRLIDRFPVGDKEKNLELLIRYRQGDMQARDRLIEQNLKLIVSYARKKVKYTESYKLLDLVHEGVLAMLNGLENFDLHRKDVQFMSYIYTCMKNRIDDVLKSTDKLIQSPNYLSSVVRKLEKITRECESQRKPIPSDEELCKLLGITMMTLRCAKREQRYSFISLNKPANEDGKEGDSELGDFIDGKDSSIDNFLDSVVDRELLAYLKLTLSPYKYYILYNRVFAPKPVYHSVLAKTLGVSRAAVQEMDSSTLKSLRKVFAYGTWKKLCRDTLMRNNVDVDNFNVSPISPANITCYLFLRDSLNSIEKKIFLSVLKENFQFDEEKLARRLNCSKRLIDVSCRSLEKKLERVNREVQEEYANFARKMIETYQTGIFDVDLDMDLSMYVTYKNTLNSTGFSPYKM